MAGRSIRVDEDLARAEAVRNRMRPFVGRERELDELRSALAAAGAGRGGALLLGGEPGIGKSSLMEVVSLEARDLGWTMLIGRCWDAGGAPGFWPWRRSVTMLDLD